MLRRNTRLGNRIKLHFRINLNDFIVASVLLNSTIVFKQQRSIASKTDNIILRVVKDDQRLNHYIREVKVISLSSDFMT